MYVNFLQIGSHEFNYIQSSTQTSQIFLEEKVAFLPSYQTNIPPDLYANLFTYLFTCLQTQLFFFHESSSRRTYRDMGQIQHTPGGGRRYGTDGTGRTKQGSRGTRSEIDGLGEIGVVFGGEY